jgi:hydrogenase maturation protease
LASALAKCPGVPDEPAVESSTVVNRGRVERCVVLGIGNPLMGDDGIGIHVIRQLQADGRWPMDLERRIEIVDGGTLGYLLIDRIAGADALIIVDAANFKAKAGTVRVLADPEVRQFLDDNTSTSVHEVGLIDLLQMLEMSGEAPRQLALVGVQPAVVDWDTELSPAVAGSLRCAAAEVSRLMDDWLGGHRT